MSRNVRTVTAPPSAVWAVLSDGWLYPVWVVGAARMREVEDHWPQVGAKLHHSVGIWPLLIDDNTEVLESEPGRLLRLRTRGWPAGEAEVVIRLAAVGTGTEITLDEDAVEGPGVVRPPAAAHTRAGVAQHRDPATALLRRGEPTGEPRMRALTWQGRGNVSVETVPDPVIEQPNDVIIEVTSTAICGSDLHLYEVLGPFLTPGDVLGHETMGVVVERGPEAGDLQVGDRVVVPFNISCGSCWMCSRGLFAQCETTQVREFGKGASLFGYTSLYGAVPGGQAELLRVPQAQFGPVKVPEGVPDERYLYLSDILPTAWQAVRYADVDEGDTLAVFGLGPVGQLTARIGLLAGCRVIGVDLVPERLALAAAHGVEVIALDEVDGADGAVEAVLTATGGRGADGTVDAVGMEAHGSPLAEKAIGLVGHLPDMLARPLTDRMAVDRTAALLAAIKSVRRGGTVSVSGVYGGEVDPMPLMEMFDRGITMRLGQCHVRRWTDEIREVLDQDEDVLGVESLATHRLPLENAPEAYEMFQQKKDGCVKVVLRP